MYYHSRCRIRQDFLRNLIIDLVNYLKIRLLFPIFKFIPSRYFVQCQYIIPNEYLYLFLLYYERERVTLGSFSGLSCQSYWSYWSLYISYVRLIIPIIPIFVFIVLSWVFDNTNNTDPTDHFLYQLLLVDHANHTDLTDHNTYCMSLILQTILIIPIILVFTCTWSYRPY